MSSLIFHEERYSSSRSCCCCCSRMSPRFRFRTIISGVYICSFLAVCPCPAYPPSSSPPPNTTSLNLNFNSVPILPPQPVHLGSRLDPSSSFPILCAALRWLKRFGSLLFSFALHHQVHRSHLFYVGMYVRIASIMRMHLPDPSALGSALYSIENEKKGTWIA